MRLEIVDHEVLQVEEVKTPNQIAIVKTHYTFAKRIKLFCPTPSIQVNTPVIVNGQWQVFDLEKQLYVDDPTESREVTVTITGPGQPVETTITPNNGKIEFEFESPIPGQFKIVANAPLCGGTEIEVVVNE